MQHHRLWGGLLGLVGGLALSCGGGDEDDSGSGGACVPGMAVVCPCPGGGEGIQTCDIGGAFFGPCDCSDGSGGQTSDTEADPTEGGDNSGSGTVGGLCGNGMEDQGECDMASPAYCPDDCESVDGGTMDTGGTTGEVGCAALPTYVAMVPTIGSRWESGALVGFGAGEDLCQQAATAAGVPDPMNVGVCLYEQVVQAEMDGEFAAIAAGTSAWIHRVTPTDVGGMLSQAGVGGRCVDWTYQTNHISDGEYVDFAGGGVLTYNLDNDTFYDGVDTTHTQPGLLECGTQMRAILCCNPPCMPAD